MSKLPTLEITTAIPKGGCPMNCLFCPQKLLSNSYTGTTILLLDDFKTIIDKIPIDVRITFAGFSEPYLNKDTTKMILYAYNKGHKVALFTTGVGMSIDDIKQLEHIKFDYQENGGFILHLPDNEGYYKGNLTKQYIELLNYIKLVRTTLHNFYYICMGTVDRQINHVISDVYNISIWSRAGSLYKEILLKPQLVNHSFNGIYEEGNFTCGGREELEHAVVLPNGDVQLCCMDYGLEYKLGNLLEQSYPEIVPKDGSIFKLCNWCENRKLY